MIKDGFFPTILYAEDFNLDNKALEKKIIEWSQHDEGVKKTNVDGWHSKTNMHELNIDEYKPLVDALYVMQKNIFKEEFLDRRPQLGNMWANINYKGGYNKPHIHPNALFSGVYYVKAPPNSGELILYDPRPGIQNVMPTRTTHTVPKHLWRDVHIAPQEGRALMFPSWLWHSVEPNKSDNIRISISFNFIQDGFQ
tara:strand:+ start:37 stop:624 length:588 start_codon:yes stop_codon:yes gene_type:complete